MLWKVAHFTKKDKKKVRKMGEMFISVAPLVET